MSLRIVNVVGARPQFVKLAPICRAIAAANRERSAGIENLIVHTGQHYDPSMSEVFFRELGIGPPQIHLNIGSGSHGLQTGRMLEHLEPVLVEHRPDVVVTYGDTNSTLAATLAAAKLHVPLAHVEAGLRSFDRRMPEEVNRITADHLSDFLFAPTPAAMANLAAEGLTARAERVGDVMLDEIRFSAARAREISQVLERLELKSGAYAVATVHRAANTDGPHLAMLLGALERLARPDRPVVLPLHPRTAARIRRSLPDWHPAPTLKPIEPLGYLDMIRLVDGAGLVLTDSGGVQKEAFFLGRPCITLRAETEWVETVEEGGNRLAGVEAQAILDAAAFWERSLRAGALDWSAGVERNFGDGAAAGRIVARLIDCQRQERTWTP